MIDRIPPRLRILILKHQQYRKDTLIAKFGGDVLMPDLRYLIANCPRRDAPGKSLRGLFCRLAAVYLIIVIKEPEPL